MSVFCMCGTSKAKLYIPPTIKNQINPSITFAKLPYF